MLYPVRSEGVVPVWRTGSRGQHLSNQRGPSGNGVPPVLGPRPSEASIKDVKQGSPPNLVSPHSRIDDAHACRDTSTTSTTTASI
jgi:hypothetical protein